MENKSFYFKRPWLKWVFLAVGLLQIWVLKDNIQSYLVCSQAEIFSPAEWEKYAVGKQFACVSNVMLVTLFIGSFLIGIFAKSKKAEIISNCTLLILMTLEICLSFLIFRPTMTGMGILWAVLAVLCLGLTAFNIYNIIIETKKE